MTLSRYAGIAVGIDSDTGRFAPTTPWGRVHGSRFCPHCLRATGGAWKLQWRLIWTFACLEHCCLLADFCPDCGGAQRYRYRIGAEPPRLGRCDNPAALETTARQHLRCGAALAQATVTRLAPEHPALNAQTAITDVIDSGIGDFGVYVRHSLPAASVLADVRALAQGILSGIGEREVSGIVPADLAAAYRDALAAEAIRERRRRIPGRKFKEKPPSAVTTAVAVTAAMAVLGRPDIASAAEQLVSLHSCVDRRKVQLAVTGSNTKRSGAASPVLWAVHLSSLGQRMTPPDQLRCRLGTVFPTRPAENIVRRDRLVMGTPTMLWPTWSLRLCPPSLFQRGARLALSAAVLLVGTPVAVGQAAALLGGQASGPQVVTVLWQLTKTELLAPDSVGADPAGRPPRRPPSADRLSATPTPRLHGPTSRDGVVSNLPPLRYPPRGRIDRASVSARAPQYPARLRQPAAARRGSGRRVTCPVSDPAHS